MNAVNTALNFLFPLITFPYVSRILEPTGYGASEFALSTAQLFALVALLGVNTYGVRECARVRDDEVKMARVAQELMIIIGVWTVMVTAAYYVCVAYIPRFQASASLFYVAGALIPLTTIGVQWLMAANEQYAFMAIRNLVVKLAVIALMFLFVHNEQDAVMWVSISVLSTGLSSIANVAFVGKNLGWQKWSGLNWRRHLVPLVVFFSMVAATTIYTMLDSVMLGIMTSDVDVAYYNVAIKLKNVLVSIIAALAGVLIPRATYYLAKGQVDEYSKVVNLSMRAAFIYSLFAAAAVMIYADAIVSLLAGNQYAESVSVVEIVMPAVVFISFTQVTSSEILTPKGREKKLAVVYLGAGILDIALNVILIPVLRAEGAAVSTTIAELFVFVAQLVIILRLEGLGCYFRGFFRLIPWEILSIALLAGGRVLLGPGLVSAIFATCVALGVLIAGLRIAKEPLVLDLLGTVKSLLDRKGLKS